VPYALEDQLVDEIETLHFALGSTLDGDRLPVAVVAHAALRAWLEACTQAGLTPAPWFPTRCCYPGARAIGACCWMIDGGGAHRLLGRLRDGKGYAGAVTEPGSGRSR